MLKCKDCKYFSESKQMSLCKKGDSWEITKPDNKCLFLPEKAALTCGDCWLRKNDMGCFGMAPDESPYFCSGGKLCPDFTDLKEIAFMEILSFWKSRDIYDRDKINKIIDDFEKDYDDLASQIK